MGEFIGALSFALDLRCECRWWVMMKRWRMRCADKEVKVPTKSKSPPDHNNDARSLVSVSYRLLSGLSAHNYLYFEHLSSEMIRLQFNPF